MLAGGEPNIIPLPRLWQHAAFLHSGNVSDGLTQISYTFLVAFIKIISRGSSNLIPRFPVRVLLFVSHILFVALVIGCGEANAPEIRDLSTPLPMLPQHSPPNRTISGPNPTVALTSSQAGINAAGDAEEVKQGAADKIPKLTLLEIPQFFDVIVVEVTDATTIRVETEGRTSDDIGMLGLAPPDDLDTQTYGENRMGQRAACLRHWDRRAREFAEIRLRGRTVTLLLQGSTLAELFSSGRLQAIVMIGNEDFNATMVELGLARTSLGTGEARSREYLSLQSRAQSLNKGLWGCPPSTANPPDAATQTHPTTPSLQPGEQLPPALDLPGATADVAQPVPTAAPQPTLIVIATATPVSLPTLAQQPTAIPTPTPAPTHPPTPKSAPAPVPTPTPTVTPPPTPTPTATPTAIPIATPFVLVVPLPTRVLLPTATPTPLPIPIPTSVTAATSTPWPTYAPTPTPTPVPTAKPKPSPVPKPLPTAAPTPAPTATTTPLPTLTPVPTATPMPSPTATQVPTPTPIPTATPAPTPTATPIPTATPVPTLSPTPAPVPEPAPAGCREGQVDINSASVGDLQKIKHIGPSRAQQMPGLRPFSSVDDMLRIKGIGAKRLAEIKEQGIACVPG